MSNAVAKVAQSPEDLARTRWSRLVAAIERLSSARSLDDVVEIVRSSARDIAGADGVTFVLREGDLCHYVAEDAISPLWAGQRFPMSACISGWSMLTGRAAVIPDIYADARIPHDAYRLTFVRSLAMTPVGLGEPLAAIGAYWAERRQPDAETVSLLETLARSTATAIANVQLYASLKASEQTARRQLETQNLLVNELNHRVRNTLAIVRSIATQTSRKCRNPVDFAADLDGRLQALSRAHELFAQASWAGADLATLIKEQLAIGAGSEDESVRATGPDVVLESQTALHLGLILFELGTNARKHGALAAPDGRIDIDWSLDASAAPPRLRLNWTETCSRAIAPREKTGFGSMMIEKGLRFIGGEAHLDFDSGGLRCALVLPIPQPGRANA